MTQGPTPHFVPVERTAENTYAIKVTGDLCVGPVGHVFLFGGAGLAAAVGALEQTFQRGLVWATSQYISFARLDDVVQLDVAAAQAGRSVTQATVTGRVGANTIFSVMAALGERDGYPDTHWRDMPDMPPPEDCRIEPLRPTQDPRAGLRHVLDVRSNPAITRDEVMSTGRSLLWMRQKPTDTHPQPAPVDAAMLAIFADFVPGAIGGALGRVGGGNSLDNNLRIRKIVPTEWVLCEMQAQAAARGFGHGHMRLYAQDGTLMATASQSIILRTHAEIIEKRS